MTIETEFADVLEVIATNLGIAAERIFGIFVSAQAMIGILNVCCVLVSVMAACFAWWYSLKITILNKDDDGTWTSDDAEVTHWLFPIFAAIVVFLVVWMLTESIDDSILKILCPEYTAMREIVRLVR